ncbi:molybdenum cofactor synthesis domain-containing protein [Enhydrobacter aerosaccus]|uniref:Molybdenum cofactor synthesis domain-containing protein n=2 Tax=Enhydrobacter aerosaccus TaxID=225324 RepID=A0A1T4TGG8_9HYPH|nr:molybdenum cofactor synthesis domain-containing protein [Enhydrobacter aerosaccus]
MPEVPAAPAKIVTACIVVIGNEILSGRTKDANISFLATELNKLGVRVMECRVIPDIEATIVATVNEVRAKFDYVFTTGGIGPTHDDITADSIAKAFGVGISEHPEAVARMSRHYGDPALFTPARRRMARIPHGATLVDNPISVAPGFQMGNVFTFAGIPTIAQSMFESMKHRLVGGDPVLSRTVRTNLPEGIIAEALGALQKRYDDIDIGSYPGFRAGKVSVSLVLRGTNDARLAAAATELIQTIHQMGGEAEELVQ